VCLGERNLGCDDAVERGPECRRRLEQLARLGQNEARLASVRIPTAPFRVPQKWRLDNQQSVSELHCLRFGYGACRRVDSSRSSHRCSALDVSSGAVVSLSRIRRRVPLVVFVLLLILLVVVLGVICVCASDHPAQALERALSVIPAAAPLSVIWSAIATVLLAASVVRVRPRLEPERASPAGLQRFLF
jgi:hypothetical protein